MQRKMIIMARVNERMYRTHNPHIPYTPEEIAQTAVECRNAGASVIHFHARGPNGEQVFAPEVYMDTVEAIRSRCDVLVDSSLGQNLIKGDEARTKHITEMGKKPSARTDMAAIDVGSNNLDHYDMEAKRFLSTDNTYLNTTATLMMIASRMKEAGVKPHLTCWNITMLRWADALIDMGVFAEPAFIQLAFSGGVYRSSHPCTTEGALAYYHVLPLHRKMNWTVVVNGTNLLPAAVFAMEKGGHLSPGIGDYEYPELGYPSNAKLVEFFANIARAYGREIATPDEAREILGLPARS